MFQVSPKAILGDFALAIRILLIDYNFHDMISFCLHLEPVPGCWLWFLGETDPFMYMNFVCMSVVRVRLGISYHSNKLNHSLFSLVNKTQKKKTLRVSMTAIA